MMLSRTFLSLTHPRKCTLNLLILTLWLLSAHASSFAQSPRLSTPQGVRVRGTTLSWRAVTRAGGYSVRWRSGSGAWQTATLPASQTRYTIHDLTPNTSYAVQVRALAAGGSDYRHSRWSRALSLRREVAATASPTPTFTPSPTPILEQVTQTEKKTERCLREGREADCSYERQCSHSCQRALPGASCVKVSGTEQCGDWQISHVEYRKPPPTAKPVHEYTSGANRGASTREDAIRSARNSVRACDRGDVQIDSWVETFDRTPYGGEWETTAYIRCRTLG